MVIVGAMVAAPATGMVGIAATATRTADAIQHAVAIRTATPTVIAAASVIPAGGTTMAGATETTAAPARVGTGPTAPVKTARRADVVTSTRTGTSRRAAKRVASDPWAVLRAGARTLDVRSVGLIFE